MSLISKHIVFSLITIGCLLTGCTSSDQPEKTKPNIIVIVADDLGWSDLGSYGNTFIETPNLDAMAADGMRFTNAYAAASLCSPSRASLMTGLHPVTVNITEHIHGNQPAGPNQKLSTPPIDQALKLEYRTIAEALKEARYHTAFIGKWHLGGGEFAPQHQGFDLNIAGSFHGLPQSFFYPFFGEGSKPELEAISGEGDYLTDVLTDRALDYLSARKDSSFFLYLSYYSPHVPIEGKPELVEKYQKKRGNAPDSLLPNVHYAAMVESIDQNVGRVREKLKELGIDKNTLVVFTSDNGGLTVREVPAFAKHTPPTTNEPLRAGKGYIYEGGIREPFIVDWPAVVPAGRNSNVPVIGQDLFNTLMEATGLEERTDDGISILPVLKGQEIAERNLYWHMPHYSPQGGRPASAIRSGDYKLIQFYEDERLELYNLAEDSGEQKNLAETENEKTRQLYRELNDWKKHMNANEPVPNPNYEGAE